MRNHRIIFTLWITASAVLFSIIPATNMMFHGADLENNTEKLFNTDAIEGYVNFLLYKAGVSGDYDNVIVGKNGWLFLGNEHFQILNKTRGIQNQHTSSSNIQRVVTVLKQRQDWLHARGIKTIFVIAPNKQSIYPEYLPLWLELPDTNSTDAFVHRAQLSGLNLIDIRKDLLSAKTDNSMIYYKTDTHWTGYGALIAYEKTITALNSKYGSNMRTVENISHNPVTSRGGDLSEFLKINTIIATDYDRGANVSFKGIRGRVCIQNLGNQNKSHAYECISETNRNVNVSEKPAIVINKNALNKESVLWINDSFGTANSVLFNKTFSKIWVVRYAYLLNNRFYEFVRHFQPDIVIYQIAERSLLALK